MLANRVLKHGLTRHGVTHPSAADVLDIEPRELRSSIRSMICRMQVRFMSLQLTHDLADANSQINVGF